MFNLIFYELDTFYGECGAAIAICLTSGQLEARYNIFCAWWLGIYLFI